MQAKSRLNLQRRRTVDLRNIPRSVADPRFEQRVQEIADRSITMLEHEIDVLPLADTSRVLVVSYIYERDRRGPLLDAPLKDELEARSEDVVFLTLTPENASARTEELTKLANNADVRGVREFRQVSPTK